MSCVILICFCRLIAREKKGWPPKLFDAFSRNRRGLSANRRSPHGGRSRPRRCSLDQPFTSQDCRGTSAARLSRECHRCVSAFETPSLGESQGLQNAATGTPRSSRSAVSDHRQPPHRFHASSRPIVSMDTKHKEFLGLLFRQGRLYTQKAKKALDHDFPSVARRGQSARTVRCGINEEGYLHLGDSHDTSQFATDALIDYWGNCMAVPLPACGRNVVAVRRWRQQRAHRDWSSNRNWRVWRTHRYDHPCGPLPARLLEI